jgi:cellulose synthase operon protein C
MPSRPFRAIARLLSLGAVTLAVFSCGAAALPTPEAPLAAMRREGASSSDGEVVGRWLLGELFAPGGSAAGVKQARRRLDGLTAPAQTSMFAALARAIDDDHHGHFRAAARAYLDAVAASRSSPHADAPLVAWYAARHLLALRASVAGLWSQGRDVVLETLDHPGNIGFRARGELVEWWSLDGLAAEDSPASDAAAAKDARDGAKNDARDDAAKATREGGKAVGALERAAQGYGCADKARMAGPFGHGATSDQRARFDAERAGPWPQVFPKDPLRQAAPRVLPVERAGCALHGVGAAGPGIFYAETYLDLPAEREMILAVQGAYAVLVDDAEVLTRDTRQWGIWPRFGVHLRLAGGRHRVLARVGSPETSIRILTERGTPLDVVTSADPTPPYALTPPVILADPNPITPFLTELGVPPQPGAPQPTAPRDTSDPVSRALAACAAHAEGQDDVSSMLLEPLVADPARATGPTLMLQASFLEKDPILTPDRASDQQKRARALAAERDPELWSPRFWLALDEADKAGMASAALKLTALADHFREVPDLWKGLVTIYTRLGWKPERGRAVREMAARFPDDTDGLEALVHLQDEEGEIKLADETVARIRKLDRDAEVDLERALARRDYPAAVKELERLGAQRKDRRDLIGRLAEVLTRAGAKAPSLPKLEAAVQNRPEDAAARLALADARLAQGDREALHKALVDAISAGADTGGLRDAIELVDGITELSPYRIDGRKVIAEYETSKQAMPGTAARVLDYSALWVHPDGSARMLEHEIIGIQSREAIEEHAEQRPPRGLLLKLRTIKRDGRVLEPEVVEGKQTVTMPHLEVGDYIETESVAFLGGDGQGGQRFEGPRWLFREEKIPYWRSEFVVISPKNRPLDIETGGPVPKPEVTEGGALAIRRWRVEKSPALPEEPASAPVQEFLPNVRVGWGINLEETLARLIDAASDEVPRDPRLVAMAERIERGLPAGENGRADKTASTPGEARASSDAGAGGKARTSVSERARRIYRWVLANIEVGRESDPRRILSGRSGNHTEAFVYLCRLRGIDASLGIVTDRLAPPPLGPMSEAENFGAVAVRIAEEQGPRWMVVREKFAPYGYMPSSLRGQPAIVLTKGAPREITPKGGSDDRVTYEGTVDLAADGSATLDLEQRFEGKLAILMRSVFEKQADSRLKELLESRLLPQSFPGARVVSAEVRGQQDLDAPLVLAMKLEMSTFARPRPGELVMIPPFPRLLGSLAALPERETPLYISEQIAMSAAMRLAVKLPKEARAPGAGSLPSFAADNDGRVVRVEDRMERGALLIDRRVDVPAGRVQPEAYARFQSFARGGDAALRREIVIDLVGGGR